MNAQRKPNMLVRAARGVANAAQAFAHTVRGDRPDTSAIDRTGTLDPTGFVQTEELRQYGWLGDPGPGDIQVCANWYERSHDIRAAVDLLAENASDITFGVTVDGERNDDHPLAQLLRNPNPHLGGRYFWRKAWSLFYLTGEVYLVGERTELSQTKTPSNLINELWALPGNWVRPIADGNYIGSYRIAPPNTRGYDFILPRDEVCELLTFNPNKQTRGMSPLRSLALSLDMEWEARKANLGIFKNGMVSQGAWVTQDAITQEQKEILRDAMGSYFGGGANAHRQMILPLGLKFERVGFSPEDMEFVDLTKLTTQQVAKVYRIPPQLLADSEHSTYNNMTEAKRQLFEEGIMPVVFDMADQLNARFAWQFGDNIRVIADTSGIAALRTDTKAEAEAVQIWVNSGFDPKWSFKRVTGEEAPDEAVADLGQLPDESFTADSTGKSMKSILTRSDADGGGESSTAHTAPAAKRRSKLLVNKEQMRQRNFDDIDLLTRQSKFNVRAALQAQCDAVQRSLETVYAQKSLRWLVTKAIDTTRPEVTPAELMWMVWSEQTQDLIDKPIKDLSVEAARKALDSYQSMIRVSVQQGVSDEAAIAKARAVAADKVVEINETTRKLVHDAIESGLRDGLDFQGMRDRINASFYEAGDGEALQMYHNRDENIARTECGRAYNTAARQAIAAAGMNAEWLCSPKPTSRDGHLHLDGHVVPADGLFRLGTYWIPNPNYDTLPPEETCNCGCTVIASESAPSPGEENNHRMRG